MLLTLLLVSLAANDTLLAEVKAPMHVAVRTINPGCTWVELGEPADTPPPKDALGCSKIAGKKRVLIERAPVSRADVFVEPGLGRVLISLDGRPTVLIIDHGEVLAVVFPQEGAATPTRPDGAIEWARVDGLLEALRRYGFEFSDAQLDAAVAARVDGRERLFAAMRA